MNTLNKVIKELMSMEDKASAEHCLRFFKCGKGEYGEGDMFLGLTSPQIKAISKKYYNTLTLAEIEKLLQNKYHDARAAALSMLVERFEKGIDTKKIFNLYLKNVSYINNWDLVDISCYKIVGRFVYENKCYSVLDKLANSGHLWSERIAIVSNMYLIKRGEFAKIKEFAVKFINHKHDLIHKAVGWLLREMGKKDEVELCVFLDKYAKKMPRTALRYAIEKFTPERRKHYMTK
ncbi:MAG: DNA alkylation repair protein [Elusimicrobia bacterium]|nr:DNA alkylation repair protein [Elusimicrobiota bacterium]